MHVCLVSPKWNKMVNSYPSLGLGYLAAYLEREGHRVTIFDLGLEPDTALAHDIAAIATAKPDLVGLTAMSSNYESALATARALKVQTGVPIVIGGPHATVLPRQVICEDCFDYLVSGEGELTLAELVQAIVLEGPQPSAATLHGIPGLYFK